ncbi:MAG: hypothetical protein ACLP8S_27760 [Solirubrobacteraceae bacterium]
MARTARGVASFVAKRSAAAHTLGAPALASVLVFALAGVLAVPAQAGTVEPPAVSSSFTPALIGAGATSALAVTITNPNASASLSAIAFGDTLQGGLTIDNPNGESGTCGSAGVVTATPGTQTFSLSGGSLKGGTSCTVSVAVTDNATEVVQNSTGLVSSSAGSSASGDTEDLTVLAPPTATITTPQNNATYTYGQRVTAAYSCAQAQYTLGLIDCSAVDDLGNSISDGQPVETNVPGTHTLTLLATSITGLVASDTVNYTVLPSNAFTVKKIKPGLGGRLGFQLALPGAGKVQLSELAGHKQVAAETLRVSGKQIKQITVKLNASGSALLAKGAFKVRLIVIYTPTGGRARTVTLGGIKLA